MSALSTRLTVDRSNPNRLTSKSDALLFEEELRQSIARDLHDDLGQKCALLTMKVAALQNDLAAISGPVASRVKELQDLSLSLAEGLQQVSHQLHPAMLEHLGLVRALRALVEDFGKRESLSAVFVAGPLPGNIKSDVSLCLYRIAQEALRNVSKHAGETPVRVTLRRRRQCLTLVVRDFGSGFDVAMVGSEAGLGLVSMQQRALLASGTLHVLSRKRVGTLVTVSIPYPAAAHLSQPRLHLSLKSAEPHQRAHRELTGQAKMAGA